MPLQAAWHGCHKMQLKLVSMETAPFAAVAPSVWVAGMSLDSGSASDALAALLCPLSFQQRQRRSWEEADPSVAKPQTVPETQRRREMACGPRAPGTAGRAARGDTVGLAPRAP